MKRYIKPISHFVKFHCESFLMANSPSTEVIRESPDEEPEFGARRKEFDTSSSWDWQDED